MHVVIFGAGAVGGYFGARLQQHGVRTTFYVRQKRAEQLKERGLRVTSPHGDLHLQPVLATIPEDIVLPNLVVVGLKQYHLEAAMPDLRKLVEGGATILPLLNGIGHMQKLTDAFGERHVLGGVCYLETTLNEHGDVIHTSDSDQIVFGATTASNEEFAREVEDTLKLGQFRLRRSADIRLDMWQKYVMLASLSGITSATQQPIGVALNDPVTRDFLHRMMTEITTIAQAEGVAIPVNTPDKLLERWADVNPQLTSSMHRDLQKGSPLELDHLHGVLLQYARKHHIDAPCLSAVYATVHPYLNGTPQR